MKPAFPFETYNPPVLTKRALLAERERRRLRRQTALLALAGLLTQLALLLLGALLLRTGETLLAAACLGYVVVSAVGGGVLTVVCERNMEVLS